MKKTFFLLCLFLTSALFSKDVLEVVLTTNSELKPLYLSKVQNDKAGFENQYLEKIRSILEFDLGNNGFSNVVNIEEEKELRLLNPDENVSFAFDFWAKEKIPYIVKTTLQKNQLMTLVYMPSKNGVKAFAPISLVGELNLDRKKIHLLCNAIQEYLFNKKGINDSRIIYTVRTQMGPQKFISEIWMCDYDGGNNIQLTYENGYCVHPVFVPDPNRKNSKNYIYVSYKKGQPKIFLGSFSNASSSAIISLRGNQLLPAISLKGDKIAFISDAAGRPDLFLQNYDQKGYPQGKPWQLFSNQRGTQASPTFSPDGNKIAFVSDKDGSPRIYVIQIPFDLKIKPVPQLLSKKNLQNVSPSWSSDGTKLAYSAKNDGERQIWIYDFITNEEWQLTKGPQNKENPYWAPDNLHIVYNTEEATFSELYIINLNQKEAIKISGGPGNKRFPAWEPR